MDQPFTLAQFKARFPDDTTCLKRLRDIDSLMVSFVGIASFLQDITN